jgi:hypothetical protein
MKVRMPLKTIEQIERALEQGNIVHWFNSRYKVIKDDGKLHVICIDNDYMTGLHPDDLKNTYVEIEE